MLTLDRNKRESLDSSQPNTGTTSQHLAHAAHTTQAQSNSANNPELSASNPKSPHTALSHLRNRHMTALYEAIRDNADDTSVLSKAYHVRKLNVAIDINGGAK